MWRLRAAERERKKQQRRNREGIFTNIDIPAEGRKSDGVHHWENNTGVVWNYKAFLLVARYHLEGEVVEEEEESGGKYVLSERRRRRKKRGIYKIWNTFEVFVNAFVSNGKAGVTTPTRQSEDQEKKERKRERKGRRGGRRRKKKMKKK